jgi:hypothetical protein
LPPSAGVGHCCLTPGQSSGFDQCAAHCLNKIKLGASEDAIWDLQEINFMGVMSKNTPINLILSITLCIDRDQINFIAKK